MQEAKLRTPCVATIDRDTRVPVRLVSRCAHLPGFYLVQAMEARPPTVAEGEYLTVFRDRLEFHVDQ